MVPAVSTLRGRMGTGRDHWDSRTVGRDPGGVWRNQTADQVDLCRILKGRRDSTHLLPGGWRKREMMAKEGVQKLGLHRPLRAVLAGAAPDRRDACASGGRGPGVCACACARVCV